LSLVELLLQPHLHLVVRVKSAGTRPPNCKDHVLAFLQRPRCIRSFCRGPPAHQLKRPEREVALLW
jgi:hypothetical protein